MTNFTTLVFETDDTKREGGVHELLCLAIHERNEDALDELARILHNIATTILPTAYLQEAGAGEEITLAVREPDPQDGTYTIFAPKDQTIHITDNDSWIRFVPQAEI